MIFNVFPAHVRSFISCLNCLLLLLLLLLLYVIVAAADAAAAVCVCVCVCVSVFGYLYQCYTYPRLSVQTLKLVYIFEENSYPYDCSQFLLWFHQAEDSSLHIQSQMLPVHEMSKTYRYFYSFASVADQKSNQLLPGQQKR